MGTRPKSVRIREMSPRDGLQIEKEWIPTERKVELIDALSRSGVHGMQYTSFVPAKWVPQFKDADEVAARIQRNPAVKYIGLIPNLKGLERAVRAGVDEISLPAAATESFARKNLNRSVAECIETVAEVVRAAPDGLVVSCALSVTFGCPYEGLVPVARVVEICERLADIGAGVITLADTTGMGNPDLVADIVGHVRQRSAGLPIAVHLHNTRGAGLANVLAALQEGVDLFDGSVGGLGGCPYAPRATGNIATEDLVNMLHGMGVQTGVDLNALVACAELAEKIVGKTLPGQVMHAGIWPPH